MLTVVLGSLMTYLLGRPAQQEIVHRAAELQMLEAKSGAVVMRRFLDRVGRSLEQTARHPGIQQVNEGSREEMAKVIKTWEGTPLGEVVLIDATGKVIVVENEIGRRVGEGVSVSDREYFTRAMSGGEDNYVIGKPILPRGGYAEGEYVIPVAVPVVRDGEKVGVLLGDVRISKLTVEYFDQIGIYDESIVYFLREDGEIMFSDQADLIGVNVYQSLDEQKIVGRELIKEELEKAFEVGEGYKVMVVPTLSDGRFVNQVGSYAAVNLDGDRALMILVTPQDKILGERGNMYIRRMIVVLIAFASLLIFGIRIAKTVGYFEGRKSRG